MNFYDLSSSHCHSLWICLSKKKSSGPCNIILSRSHPLKQSNPSIGVYGVTASFRQRNLWTSLLFQMRRRCDCEVISLITCGIAVTLFLSLIVVFYTDITTVRFLKNVISAAGVYGWEKPQPWYHRVLNALYPYLHRFQESVSWNTLRAIHTESFGSTPKIDSKVRSVLPDYMPTSHFSHSPISPPFPPGSGLETFGHSLLSMISVTVIVMDSLMWLHGMSRKAADALAPYYSSILGLGGTMKGDLLLSDCILISCHLLEVLVSQSLVSCVTWVLGKYGCISRCPVRL